jgi:nucleotide-binding universal stress UspA family protein
VRFGARLACAGRSELCVVTVGDLKQSLFRAGSRPPARALSRIEEEDRRSAEGILSGAAREAARHRARVRCAYVEARRLAPIAQVISRRADRERADLLVVGREGRGAVGRWVFGSVARRLAHETRRPLVVVPPGRTRIGRAPLKILVATDGSRGAKAALRFGARLARDCRARLIVLTVGTLSRDLAVTAPRAILSLVPHRQLLASERRAARQILQAAAREVQGIGPRPALRFFQPRGARPVAVEMAREAERLGADLIVVGSQGAGALVRLALGSVAQRLLQVARRPVALVRPRPRRRTGRPGVPSI